MHEVFYERAVGPAFAMNVKGSTHMDYTDLGLISPMLRRLGVLGPVGAGRMQEVMNGTSWTELSVGQRFSALDVENGIIAYWHDPGSETRSNTLTVRLVDGGTSAGAEAASAAASVTFSISNVNDAPVASNTSIVVDEGTGETASTLPTNPASVKVLTTAILSVTDSDDTVSNFNNGSGEGYY